MASHEYMSLVTPNGRFTMGYRGEKMSGKMATVPGLFDKMINHVNGLMKSKKAKNFGEAFETLADPKVMTSLWPDWDKVAENPFKPNDRVVFIDPKYKKYGVMVVHSVKKDNVVMISGDHLRQGNKNTIKAPAIMIKKA
jgi:hypothetical protein